MDVQTAEPGEGWCESSPPLCSQVAYFCILVNANSTLSYIACEDLDKGLGLCVAQSGSDSDAQHK